MKRILRLMQQGCTAWAPHGKQMAYICSSAGDGWVFTVRVRTLQHMVESGLLIESINPDMHFALADRIWKLASRE